MQFNLVVSTNTAGIRCWQRNSFQVVGTLAGAFRHRQLGYVDALVMTQAQVEGSADQTAGLLLLLSHPGFQRLTQVIAWLQPQRHHLHGLGPSTSPWIITKAST